MADSFESYSLSLLLGGTIDGYRMELLEQVAEFNAQFRIEDRRLCVSSLKV